MGATPVVVLLPLAILIAALIHMMGERVKGENMNTNMTISTKFYVNLRNLVGNILIMTAAWGIGATAGVAGLQL